MANTYDRFGFDKDGYNKDGFDRMGYNREGLDREGYDKNGVNKLGINKLTGYDEEGYDSEGYDRDGYNREGYDKQGFDLEGYNLAGYNREGYDKRGFDIEGYNAAGYDRQGYDKSGYDENGYDKDGYNRSGLDENGFDVDGFDAYGFNQDGINKNGYDINGRSEDGIDILGYAEDGFDVDGKSIDGFPKEKFDEEGYHIYTGFNLKGFDRDGFNINGVDREGYDREGFHCQTGYNREGFDREGYRSTGYNADGYDRKGYNREGYDRDGYDIDGYDKSGYDRDGYNREGYDKKGYDKNGYDKTGTLEESRRNQDKSGKIDKKEDAFEAAFFKKCERQIKGYYRDQVKKEVMKQYVPTKLEYIDRWGFVHSDTIEPDMERANSEINHRVDLVLSNPYFCHIDYIDNPELYIGKQAVHGWITDWADERAKLYYQYQIYIGNKDVELNLVRDIHFSKGKYKGYKDLYYKSSENDKTVVADEHLQQIIQANQDNKAVHDIVESIQQNQYDIISSDKDKSMLVLGCAGSGKTMILMHKVRYMKYNDQDLNMKDIMIISPTDILERESRQLSRLLQVDRVLQFTSARFYLKLCVEMMKKMGTSFEAFVVCDENVVEEEFYQYEDLEQIKTDVYMDLSNDTTAKSFINSQEKKNKDMFSKHIAITGCEITYITKMHNLYADSIKEIEKAGKRDIQRIIKRINEVVQEQNFLLDLKEFVTYLVECSVFENNIVKKAVDEDTISQLFYETKKIVKNIDYAEFYRVMHVKKECINDPVKMIQVVQLYLNEKLDLDGVHKVLHEWSAISEDMAETYIEYISNQIDRLEKLQKKSEILEYLLDTDTFQNRYQDNNQMRFDTSFEKMLNLYEGMEEPLQKIGMTPFEYFSIYEKITRRRRRLSEQKKQPLKRAYLFDALLAELNVDYTLDGEIKIPLSKLFTMTYILQAFAGAIDTEKKYIFIDEFQDFSPNELRLMKSVYPKAVFNLYGDVKQCINSKGICEIEDIPGEMYEEQPKFISENYRNARQITEYIQDVVGIKMLPVGLNGVQKTVDFMPNIVIAMDDRIAVITESITDELRAILQGYDVNYYEETGEIIRGIYNILPISLAKGLEFEKVIVIQQGMTMNEYYVACTRAIKELYVVSGELAYVNNDSDNGKQEDFEVENCTAEKEFIEDSNEDAFETESQNVDLHGYTLFPYQGKLRKYTHIKNMPATHIPIVSDGKEKMIPVCYLEETKCVYIPEGTYKKHKNELETYFSNGNKDNNKMQVVVEEKAEKEIITMPVHKEEIIEKPKENRPKRDLVTFIFDDTRTVDLMDKFEGLSGEKPYERLIIKRALSIRVGTKFEFVDLVLERSRNRDYQGNITFTEFKKGNIVDLKRYVQSQFSEDDVARCLETGDIKLFRKPYLLRAQNSRNRSGYGWEWDWSNPYSPSVMEGTFYGETTSYVFVGAYIRK